MEDEKMQSLSDTAHESIVDSLEGIRNTELLLYLKEEREKFSNCDKSLMGIICDELIARHVYPSHGNNGSMCALRMVEAYGVFWHQYNEPHFCNHCQADLRDHDNGPPFKRELGEYCMGTDRTIRSVCYNCKERVK